MIELSTALWSDLKTDADRSAWLLLGRGVETGVIAPVIQADLAMAYHRLSLVQIRIERAKQQAVADGEMFDRYHFAALVEDRVAAVPQPQVVDWPEVSRLLETVKYLIGIAERGAGRKMREDETTEQFVLGYVQSLEQPQGDQEPYLWYDPETGATWTNESLADGYTTEGLIPLYEAPQPRQPLTDDEHERLMRGRSTLDYGRAIERAHGIK